MKNISLSIIGLAFPLSFALQGQSLTDTTQNLDINFSGAIESGMRTYTSGNVSGGGSGGEIGAYVNPSFGLNYENKKVSLDLSYGFEAFGGSGFGTQSNDDFSETVYYQHNPNFNVSGTIADGWKISAMADLLYTFENTEDSDNLSEVVLQPKITYALSDSTTIGASYQYYRAENMDQGNVRSLDGGETASFFAEDATAFNNTTVNQAIQNALSQTQNSLSNRHVGVIHLDSKISEAFGIRTYAHAGRRNYNTKADRLVYRVNTDLSAKFSKALKAGLRYRFNIRTPEDGSANEYYNLVRVTAGLSLTEAWAVNLANEGVIADTTAQGNKAGYENETYLGLAYSF